MILSMLLYAYFCVSFSEITCSYPLPFFYIVVGFFFLCLQSISSINPLSILDITNIFSFSVHYLLTIFMMSFVRKKSLILMYSNHPFPLICRPLLSFIKSLSSLLHSIGPFISIKPFSLLWLWNVSYYVIGQVPLPYHSFSMLIQLSIDFYYSKSILK